MEIYVRENIEDSVRFVVSNFLTPARLEHLVWSDIRFFLLGIYELVGRMLGGTVAKWEIIRAITQAMPECFHPSWFPTEWWNNGKELSVPMNKSGKVSTYKALLNSLPENRRKERSGLLLRYLNVLSSMDSYYRSLKDQNKSEVALFPFEGDKDGQMMANFWVKDLARKEAESYNWHGQNTSQWVFAGCILSSEDGSFSVHT